SCCGTRYPTTTLASTTSTGTIRPERLNDSRSAWRPWGLRWPCPPPDSGFFVVEGQGKVAVRVIALDAGTRCEAVAPATRGRCGARDSGHLGRRADALRRSAGRLDQLLQGELTPDEEARRAHQVAPDAVLRAPSHGRDQRCAGQRLHCCPTPVGREAGHHQPRTRVVAADVLAGHQSREADDEAAHLAPPRGQRPSGLLRVRPVPGSAAGTA